MFVWLNNSALFTLGAGAGSSQLGNDLPRAWHRAGAQEVLVLFESENRTIYF